MKRVLARQQHAALFFLIALLAGCSAPQKSAPAVHTVEIKGMKFIPANIVVNKGDTVVFTNLDYLDHDITEASKLWHSPQLAPNSSYKMIATKSTGYYCSIHPVMTGKLTVD